MALPVFRIVNNMCVALKITIRGCIMRIGSLLLTAALFMAFVTSAAHAEIYKWKDKDGSIRYSDVPPPSNIKNESISKKISRPAAPAAVAPSAIEKDAAANPKDAPPLSKEEAAAKNAKEAEAKKRAEAEKQAELKYRQENCAIARKNLAAYGNGGRIATTDDKGERRYLGDDEIMKGKADAQRDVEKFCD